MGIVRRISQHDLARKLGVSQVTVSRALAGSPMVAKETADLIRAEAMRRGYAPDPALASLNAYRRTKRPVNQGQVLAWFSPEKPLSGDSWFIGARERAGELGYRLETFLYGMPGMSLERSVSILHARGVRGLVVGPQRKPHTYLNVDLDRFATVAIGYSVETPVMDRITTDHHYNVMMAWERMHAAGYRRIGMLVEPTSEDRVEGRRIGAYKYMQSLYPRLVKIPTLSTAHDPLDNKAEFAAWLKRWKPDGLLVHNPNLLQLCENMGLDVPGDIGLVAASLTGRWENYGRWAGVDQDLAGTGALAVDTLVARIHKNEYGQSSQRRVHMIGGRWKDGATIGRL